MQGVVCAHKLIHPHRHARIISAVPDQGASPQKFLLVKKTLGIVKPDLLLVKKRFAKKKQWRKSRRRDDDNQ